MFLRVVEHEKLWKTKIQQKQNKHPLFNFLIFWNPFINFFFCLYINIFVVEKKKSVFIHIIRLYSSMIRAEDNYSRLTVVEEIIWRRERLVRMHTHARTHAHTHTHTHWIGKSDEDARVS